MGVFLLMECFGPLPDVDSLRGTGLPTLEKSAHKVNMTLAH